MRGFATGTAIAFGISILNTSVFAEDKCPKGNSPIFEEDLQAAPDCAAAHALHDFCAWGSTGDRRLAQVVIAKCEAIFIDKLRPAEKRSYDAKIKACGDKARREYNHDGGTIALSEGAMCEEGVAAAYARSVANAANPPTVKASFDCRKAESLLELAICSSDSVGAADINLSKAYRKAAQSATPDARDALVESERSWLNHVVSACLSVPPADAASQSCVRLKFVNRTSLIARCMAKSGAERTACLNNYESAPGPGMSK